MRSLNPNQLHLCVIEWDVRKVLYESLLEKGIITTLKIWRGRNDASFK